MDLMVEQVPDNDGKPGIPETRAAPAIVALARLPRPAAVVCRTETCSAPVHEPGQLRAAMHVR